MSMTRKQRDALTSASVGVLHWDPPHELEEVAGSQRGGRAGFSVGMFGSSRGHAPRVRWRYIDASEALDIAADMDRLLNYESTISSGPTSCVQWVQSVIDALPEALADAIVVAEARVDGLTKLRRQARGLGNAA